MAIKPILFNSHMVRAILDGRKTVTRRVVKVPENYRDFCGTIVENGFYAIFEQDGLPQFPIVEAPYAPEDLLWVRETWNYGYFDVRYVELDLRQWDRPFLIDFGYVDDFGDFVDGCGDFCYFGERFKPLPINYDRNSYIGAQAGYVYQRDCSFERACKLPIYIPREELLMIPWRPPIQMPREAARIWLRVTNVRVERLQAIDEAGAEAEGGQALICKGKPVRTAREDFALAWGNTIKSVDYLRYCWEANPWVWVIEFERCEKPEQ